MGAAILDLMIGRVDERIRSAVFAWLADQPSDVLSRTALAGFRFGDQRIPLIGPRGIWKPAACELPISITTTLTGPYDDAQDRDTGLIRYAYRGTDPLHADNVGLRRAMHERVPLVYFFAVERGWYLARWPAFVTGDEPTRLRFSVQVDLPALAFDAARDGGAVSEDEGDARRAYVTRSVRQRLHQVAFRERVMKAYAYQCTMCRLRHRELLDAAHITPDTDPEGEPVVSNGLALCKLHHAAFDNFFFAVRPDYTVEVRRSILAESDGPMLVVGLQDIHGKLIELPQRRTDRPDPRRLESRYARFLGAS